MRHTACAGVPQTPGTARQYQQLRRNLAAIANLDL